MRFLTDIPRRTSTAVLMVAVAVFALMMRGQKGLASWYTNWGGLMLNGASLTTEASERAKHELTRGAERAFYQALDSNPGSSRAHYLLGSVYTILQDPESAAVALAQASELAPMNRLAAFQLGHVEAGLGREMAARTAWRQARTAVYFMQQAQESSQVRDYKGALLAADRALSVDPDLASAHLIRGKALQELEQYSGALASFQVAAELTPMDPEPAYRAALLLGHQLDRTQEALVMLDRALKANPTYVPGLLERARYDRADGACGVAAVRLAPLLEADVSSDDAQGAALRLVGACYLDQNDHATALPVLLQAVVLDTESPSATWLLARAYQGIGDREAALLTCQRVLALQPDHPQALVLLEELTTP